MTWVTHPRGVLLGLTIASCAIAAATPAAVAAQQRAYPALAADHHVHVRSESMADALMQVQEAVGQEMYAENPGGLGGGEVIAALDAAGVERAALISTAYMYGLPEIDFESEHRRVRAENDFVAAQAERFPDRLVAFASVNPNRGYALDEIRRVSGVDGVVGLKLHLANSDVDLTDPVQVERLREVFLAAERVGLAVAIHMRTRSPDYGASQAATFIDEVLSAAPELQVQVAHMAGWGGFDDATDAALGEFADAIEAGRTDGSRLWFDLSGVAASLSRAAAADMVPEIREAHDRLVERIRDVGIERVVFGSDWDAIGIAEQAATIAVALPLTPAEVSGMFEQSAPWLQR